MNKPRCISCDHIHDGIEEAAVTGIPANAPFENLLSDWQCPICEVSEDEFEKREQTNPNNQCSACL